MQTNTNNHSREDRATIAENESDEASYAIAAVEEVYSDDSAHRYTVRHIQGTPKAYKLWTVIGWICATGVITVPFPLIMLVSVMASMGWVVGESPGEAVFPSFLLGALTSAMGVVILNVTRFIFWWKYG